MTKPVLEGFDPTTIDDPALREVVQTLMNQVETLHAQVRSQAADKLRNNLDAAEYKHVVLGLIFLKYISDAFEERRQQLLTERDQGADPEDPDEYRAENVFWVPQAARWVSLQDNARLPTIGKMLDDAMVAIDTDLLSNLQKTSEGTAGAKTAHAA